LAVYPKVWPDRSWKPAYVNEKTVIHVRCPVFRLSKWNIKRQYCLRIILDMMLWFAFATNRKLADKNYNKSITGELNA